MTAAEAQKAMKALDKRAEEIYEDVFQVLLARVKTICDRHNWDYSYITGEVYKRGTYLTTRDTAGNDGESVEIRKVLEWVWEHYPTQIGDFYYTDGRFVPDGIYTGGTE